MTKPNFLFIGPDKAGSSWLFEILRAHPDCYVPPAKDIYFFDRFYNKGMDWYLSHFKEAKPNHKAIGELSHDYMYSEDAAARIARDFPDMKLIMCLRQPAERSFSQYLYLKRSGEVGEGFEQAMEKFPKILDHSLYAPCIQRYLRHFDAQQIQILFFDDLQADARDFARQIFRFLDVPYLENLPYDVRVREAGAARNKYLSRILKCGAEMARCMGLSNIVGKIKHGVVGKIAYRPFKQGEKPTLSKDERESLMAYFGNDIAVIERLTARDLSNWRKMD